MRARRLCTTRLRARRGFTLVELTVAMLLIVVGLLGSAALMSTSLRFQRGSSTREDMVTIAQGKLDELRSYQRAPKGSAAWSKLAVGGSVTTSVTGYDSVVTVGARSYRLRWQLTADVAGTRFVTVRVQPISMDTYATGQVQFRTLVSPQ
jgi:prepilin-type N-terminal cleavage/methylation domain-containing protein